MTSSTRIETDNLILILDSLSDTSVDLNKSNPYCSLPEEINSRVFLFCSYHCMLCPLFTSSLYKTYKQPSLIKIVELLQSS